MVALPRWKPVRIQRPARRWRAAAWTRETAVGTAGLALGLAGVLHLAQAPMHLDHSWEHAAALAGVGLVDLAWTMAWCRKRTRWLILLGWFLASLTVTLYAISRFLPLPFEGRPEEVEGLGLGTQLFELAAWLALASVSTLSPRAFGRTARPLAITCAIAVVAAWLLFGAASLAALAVQGGAS